MPRVQNATYAKWRKPLYRTNRIALVQALGYQRTRAGTDRNLYPLGAVAPGSAVALHLERGVRGQG
jgi:hypothetical protein